ncbi:hypothetical protein EmuJ_000350200 [Echinococcus multilocularis]|uniref:Uncharacterized protein n=1 Tax=Echinococcus multilocularis TaxID=6211 RepID=A0A068XW29_ECHMU|nr:hypothetical protein EmuJ_000350200 [Echinococcus multilocularis]
MNRCIKSFSGASYGQLVKATKRRNFNSTGLELSSASYQVAINTTLAPASVAYDEVLKIVTFEFPSDLQCGKGHLSRVPIAALIWIKAAKNATFSSFNLRQFLYFLKNLSLEQL